MLRLSLLHYFLKKYMKTGVFLYEIGNKERRVQLVNK